MGGQICLMVRTRSISGGICVNTLRPPVLLSDIANQSCSFLPTFLHLLNMLTKLFFLSGLALTFLPASLCQSGLRALSGCQLRCVITLLNQATSLGCALTADYATLDIACLCTQPNFEYGIRDCIHQSCPPEWENSDNAYLQVCGRQLFGAVGVC
jgi:hypothetical protein